MIDLGPVKDAMEAMTSDLLGIAVLVAGIGALAMAVLEAVKAMLPLRARFHRDEIERWMKGEHRSLDAKLMGVGFTDLPSAGRPTGAFKQLLDLAIGGAEYQTALFEQAPEKMFGQIQAAVNVAMDFPQVAPDLYEFLTRDPDSPRAGMARIAMQRTDANRKDQDVWRGFAADLNAGRVNPRTEVPAEKAKYLEANQARQRLDNLVRRRLDALQTRIAYRWGRYNQFAAFFLAVLFTVIALWHVPHLNGLAIAVLAVVAGFLAPPAKDLAAALSNIRYR